MLENVSIIVFAASPALQRIANRTHQYLTPTEMNIFSDIQNGFSDKEIAKRRNISTNTVKVHVRHMLQKTHTNNRNQLVSKAFETQLTQANIDNPVLKNALTQAKLKDSFDTLGKQETRIAEALVTGMRTKEMAEKFNVTEGTIKGQIKTVLNKLHLDDRTQIIPLAEKLKLFKFSN